MQTKIFKILGREIKIDQKVAFMFTEMAQGQISICIIYDLSSIRKSFSLLTFVKRVFLPEHVRRVVRLVSFFFFLISCKIIIEPYICFVGMILSVFFFVFFCTLAFNSFSWSMVMFYREKITWLKYTIQWVK